MEIFKYVLYDLCLRISICACFGTRHSPTLTDIAAIETILNIFSYDVLLGRDSNLLPSRYALYVTLQLRVCLLFNMIDSIKVEPMTIKHKKYV